MRAPLLRRYMLPALSLIPAEAEECVRVEYAGILAQLAATGAPLPHAIAGNARSSAGVRIANGTGTPVATLQLQALQFDMQTCL